jgi:hypothetical protein
LDKKLHQKKEYSLTVFMQVMKGLSQIYADAFANSADFGSQSAISAAFSAQLSEKQNRCAGLPINEEESWMDLKY